MVEFETKLLAAKCVKVFKLGPGSFSFVPDNMGSFSTS